MLHLEKFKSRPTYGTVQLNVRLLNGQDIPLHVAADSSVDGVLWLIDTDHLKSLDHLEGYPYYYDRDILPVQYQGNIVMAECYRMQPDNPDDYPSQEYLNMLSAGYREHGVPWDQIEAALDNVAKKQQDFVAKIPQKSSSFLKKYDVKR